MGEARVSVNHRRSAHQPTHSLAIGMAFVNKPNPQKRHAGPNIKRAKGKHANEEKRTHHLLNRRKGSDPSQPDSLDNTNPRLRTNPRLLLLL